jgi:hypothetical protein
LGHIKPDFEIQKALSDAKKEIDNKGSITRQEKIDILRGNGVRNPEDWIDVVESDDMTLAYKKGLVKRFLVFSAIANGDEGFKSGDDNKLIQKITDD